MTTTNAHTPGHSPDEGRYYGQLYPKDAVERDRLREINAELLAALKEIRCMYRDVPNYLRDGTTLYLDGRDLADIDAVVAKATGQGGVE